MKKINLTEAEIEVIKRYENGEINTFTPEEKDREILQGIIHKAEDALDDYPDDEFDDLVLWYYGKFQEQNTGDGSEAVMP